MTVRGHHSGEKQPWVSIATTNNSTKYIPSIGVNKRKLKIKNALELDFIHHLGGGLSRHMFWTDICACVHT